MTELEALMAERSEINRRIKELRDKSIVRGRAKYEAREYPTHKVDYIVSFGKQRKYRGKVRWTFWPIVQAISKDAAISELESLAADIERLLAAMKGESA